jgi:hypothetical protein
MPFEGVWEKDRREWPSAVEATERSGEFVSTWMLM